MSKLITEIAILCNNCGNSGKSDKLEGLPPNTVTVISNYCTSCNRMGEDYREGYYDASGKMIGRSDQLTENQNTN